MTCRIKVGEPAIVMFLECIENGAQDFAMLGAEASGCLPILFPAVKEYDRGIDRIRITEIFRGGSGPRDDLGVCGNLAGQGDCGEHFGNPRFLCVIGGKASNDLLVELAQACPVTFHDRSDYHRAGMPVTLARCGAQLISEFGAIGCAVQITEDTELFTGDGEIDQTQFLPGFDSNTGFGQARTDGMFTS